MRCKRYAAIVAMALLAVAMIALVLVAAPPASAGPTPDTGQANLWRLPFMRRNHSLVYDGAHNRLLLFGGWDGRRLHNDLWALDLALGGWTQIHPAGTPPPPRAWHTAFVDTEHDRMYITDGQGSDGVLCDLWALTLTPGSETWIETSPTRLGKAGESSAAEPGAKDSGRPVGQAEVRALPEVEMPGRYGAAAVYEPGTDKALVSGGMLEGELFAGIMHLTTEPGAEHWSAFWITGTQPTAWFGTAAVWDDARDEMIVFGGAGEEGNSNEVHAFDPYTFNDATWTRLTPTGPAPSPRRFATAVLVNDGGTNAMLLFGGLGDSGFLNDVWKLTLTPGAEAWQQLSPAGGPPGARAGHAAALDPVDGRLYTIGGFGTYPWLIEQQWALDLTPGAEAWQRLTAGYQWPGLDVALQVEDAREGVVVHALPDSTLSVAVKLYADYNAVSKGLTVTLTVHGDVLDLTGAALRSSDGGPETPVAVDDLGGGRYRVSGINLHLYGGGWTRQVVFYFYLPADVALGATPFTAQVEVPGTDTVWDATGLVHVCRHAEALVVANRTLLYQRYDEQEVSDLLAALYEAVQGDRRNGSPMGVVTYLDRYTSVGGWDNTAVDYGNPLFVNMMAMELHDELLSLYSRADAPAYLLIVGDDDTIPFYRHHDPTRGVSQFCYVYGICDEEYPALYALANNYYFTDDYYGDIGGAYWFEGDVEMATGRLVGETAADMLTLLRSGADPRPAGTGKAALFSLVGWQLGLEPVAPLPDAIPNVLDVAGRFVDLGFEVHNDTEWPRTVDILDPDWEEEDLDAILADGFDLFFHGGVSGLWMTIAMPGDLYPFEVDDYRIAADRPVFVLATSYQGLPVPPTEGGVTGVNLLLSLAHGGSSAIIGATAEGWGSFYSLDYCFGAELFMQTWFDALLALDSDQTAPIGVALQQAKQNYPFGVGSGLGGYPSGIDENVVTEYVLYGVPWQTLPYPTSRTSLPLPLGGDRRSVQRVELQGGVTAVQCSPPGCRGDPQSGTYNQSFTLNFTYTDVVSGGWQIITVPGTRLDASDGYPLIPTAEAVTLCLPVSATVTALEVISDTAIPLGARNIPVVDIPRWGEGSLGYTTTTTLDELYPSTIVAAEGRGRFLVLRVMPVQHNPTTDATLFHQQVQVRITYTAPTPVAICAYYTDRRTYLPGQTVETLALVRNAGAVGLVVTPTLSIINPLTRTWSVQAGLPVTLPAGGSAVVPLTTTAPLEEGAYRAVLGLWRQRQRLAASSRDLDVRRGQVAGLDISGLLLPGRPVQIGVTFANDAPAAAFAFVRLAILDASGRPVDEPAPQVVAVAGGGTATATFDWTVPHLPAGRYSVAAWVTAGEEVYGPLSRSFRVTAVYLPVIVRNH
jgi:Galactose oxidase, central domain/Peptidase family C25